MSITLSKCVCGNCSVRKEDGYCYWDDRQKEPTQISCFRLNDETFVDRGYVDEGVKAILDHPVDIEKVLKELEEEK